MPAKVILHRYHKLRPVLSIALLVGTCLVISCRNSQPKGLFVPVPQTTWTITYSPAQTPPYQVDYDPPADKGGCSYATPTPAPDPLNLKICQHDIVRWKGNSPGEQHRVVVYVPDPIFLDNSGKSTTNFIGSDNQVTDPPANVDPSTTPGTAHEWYIALFDRQNVQNSKCDDPKIIVEK
jgi:hypothetical protein